MKHLLDPLLRPRSVAIVGASARKDSMGAWSLENLRKGGFGGDLYPVNPGYDELQGSRCYASLAELPGKPEMVIFALGDNRLEQVLDEAIALGIPGAVIMSSLCIDDDQEPLLKQRVRQKIHHAGMLVCGANGMGFYNVRDNTWACGFDSRSHAPGGNVSLISHSGSGMCGIIDCEERLGINLAVSTGNELSVTMDQYLDFALDLPETKVVGLFIETARNPAGFRAALEKAAHRKIPVVALKVGKTRKSAELAISHSGAMAGDDATYDALFSHYGVHRVGDMDEFATALILFSQLCPLGPGGLATLHDSGGERQLMVDLADATQVPMTDLATSTVNALEQLLDPELPAVNPLDAWSRGGKNAEQRMDECFSVMMQDAGVAVGAIVLDRAPDSAIYEPYIHRMERARKGSGKPVALVAARQGSGSDPLAVTTTLYGLPVLDGVTTFLRGVRGLMNYRDFQASLSTAPVITDPPQEIVDRWLTRLAQETRLDEATSLVMLREFGVETSNACIANSEGELITATQQLTWPLVLKTAMPGMLHKSDHRGVAVNIADKQHLISTYRDFCTRLGPRVLVAAMAPPGIEMILGVRRDPQFGPVIIMGFGGVLAEVLGDVTFLLPPFDATCARRRLADLKLRPLLDGVRGGEPVALDRFCETAAKFAVMVYSLQDRLQEIDVNPVIVGKNTCVAVDALTVSYTGGKEK
jgi:acetate---CoA ligase (ADP-forming)